MPILTIHHVTHYRYRNPVSLGEHRMMFRPLESHDQRVLSASLEISPDPSQLRYVHDVFGNSVGIARFAERARDLVFDSRISLEHTPLPAFAGYDGDVEAYSATMPFAYSAEDLPDLARSIERLHPDPDKTVERWARSFVRGDGRTSLQVLLADMTQAIRADFRYATRLRGGAQSPLQTLELRTGTCRDFAMLMIEAVRSLGLAAQFVSGYIRTYGPAGAQSARGGGHTHAWVRVYLPACGWVEFDPRQALPLHGTWRGASDDFLGMDVSVDVNSALEPAV